MPSEIQLSKDNIIEVDLPETVTGKLVRQYIQEILVLRKVPETKNLPFLILIDFHRVKNLTADARQAAFLAANMLGFDKLAEIGLKPRLKRAVQLMIFALGAKGRVEFFDTKEEGLRWLKS